MIYRLHQFCSILHIDLLVLRNHSEFDFGVIVGGCLPILCPLFLTGAFSVWKICFITWQQCYLNVVEVGGQCIFSFYIHFCVIDTLYVVHDIAVNILTESWQPIVSICFLSGFIALSHLDLGTFIMIFALLSCKSCNICGH